MKRVQVIIGLLIIVMVFHISPIRAQNQLKLSGYLQTDQRILLQSPNDWVWNENRLSLQLDKKVSGKAKFHSEVWLRNMGIPNISTASDLYNLNIIDPWNLEIREAYVQVTGFLSKNLDMAIGRQRIAWGTADKMNPTDNLNPYDFEDILDFGRHRGSDALNLNYWFNTNTSLQAVYIPFFRPDNLPVGMFANIFTMPFMLPAGLSVNRFSDSVQMPQYNFRESSTYGVKLKGLIGGFNVSISYVWGWNGLPDDIYNTFIPVDTTGSVNIRSTLTFHRHHIFGADLAGNIGGVGIWAEAALFLPANDVVMTNNLSALYPTSPVPVTQQTTLLKKQAYVKYIVGGDYFFANGGYLNVQFLHGFVNEVGRGNLNDYLFARYEQKFLNDKLNVIPLSGAIIVSDWKEVKNNYAVAYMPEVSYMATDNAELSVSAVFFKGKGDNLFANLNGYNMLVFKVKYSF
ncbi:MAG: hypothetical protein JXR71_09720 [Bacteroidales bacterium]|nr:hypothetical protein [Bacteroidales bacterium]